MSSGSKIQELKSYYQNAVISGTHQDFLDASEKEKAYREKLVKYQTEKANEPDADSAAMIESMTAIADMVSLAYTSLFGTSQLPVSTPKTVQPSIAASQQYIPTEAELLRLCQSRNAAFFAYMHALYPENVDDEIVDTPFDADHTKIHAIDELTRPYRLASRNLARQCENISTAITTVLQARRTWLDMIIESIIPSFILKAMDYKNFQDLMQDQVQELSQEYMKLGESQTILTVTFRKNWEITFSNIGIPSDLSAANSYTLIKCVHGMENSALENAYRQYDKNKTVNTLLNLYRLALQIHHQTAHDDTLHIITSKLEGVIHQLEQLHPDRQHDLQKARYIVEQEMELFEKYASYLHPQPLSKSALFMQELADKYMEFLKTRTFENFEDLYQHIHSHPQYRQLDLVQSTRTLLKTLYPEAYRTVRQHQVTHINEEDRINFLKKYASLSQYDLPIYKSMLAFMRDPSHDKLHELENIIAETNDYNDYSVYLDSYFASIIDNFMHIGSKMTQITVEDCSSDQSSVCESEPASPRSDTRSMSIDSQVDDAPMTVRTMDNLATQDRRFDTVQESSLATSSHGLFANVKCSDQLNHEAQQMLKAYRLYQADIQTRLLTVISKMEQLNTVTDKGIMASLQIMMSNILHPLVALMNLFMSNCTSTDTMDRLSQQRNALREESYTLQTQFETTWQEKFGTHLPKGILEAQDTMVDREEMVRLTV